MQGIRSAAVYCGASNNCDEKYREAARKMGAALAEADIRLVYGGGQVGLMGVIANAAIEAGGNVTGYITQHLESIEGRHKIVADLHVVDTMHERKQRMFEGSDAFIIMPGGFGTMEELFEVLTWKQIGLHNKEIIFLNIDGYWNTFLSFVEHMIASHFVRAEHRKLFAVIEQPDDVIRYFEDHPIKDA